MNKLSVRNVCVLLSKRKKLLYSRCFNDPKKCREPVLDKVLSSTFKMVYNCKNVLSSWFVKSAA